MKEIAEKLVVPAWPRRLDKSNALKRKAEKIIPSCSQTFSKGPSQFVQGVAPVYLEKGFGCTVCDVDGNEYLDFGMALGAVLIGYADPRTTHAIEAQLKQGISLTLSHPLEVELAEKLTQLIPCAEMVRFGKNGSDATSAAVRVARAFTGRDIILCCGYHGWQDWFIGTTTRRKGIPSAISELTKVFRYNDLDSLQSLFNAHPDRIAAVIMEPVGLIEPKSGFLDGIRELTQQNGAVLIFDEIVTGFRFGLGGVQKLFGVTPDLACFGKGMGNGMPISAVVGARKIMELFDEVFFSSTFGGETASLAAALAVIETLERPGAVETLWKRGQQMRDGYNALAREFGLAEMTQCVGLPPRTGISFLPEAQAPQLRTFFQQECIKRGLLFTGAHNICLAHTEADVEKGLKIYRTVLELLAQVIRENRLESSLEGPVLQPVFRKL